MPDKGVFLLRDVSDDIAAMHWTHQMAHELGAPDLKEPALYRDAASGPAAESSLTRSAACARLLTRRAIAQESLRRRPVDGFFVRCGHEKREDTIYRDAKGERCRICRNAKRREARAA